MRDNFTLDEVWEVVEKLGAAKEKAEAELETATQALHEQMDLYTKIHDELTNMVHKDNYLEEKRLREKAEAELAKEKEECKRLRKVNETVVCDLDEMKMDRDGLKEDLAYADKGLAEADEAYFAIKAERDRLKAMLEKIATDYDCDPRAEARDALEEVK